MIDGLARVGGHLASEGLGLLLGFLAVLAGYWGHKLTQRKWVGWTSGLLTFFLLAIVFGPAINVLQSLSCRGVDDYQDCIDN